MGSDKKVEAAGKEYTPEEISAMILSYLKDYADSELIPSNRGYKLKTNCSKEQIKEKINALLKLKFK